METVLADPDLLPLVLWAIKDPDPEVAGFALDSWVATSRTIHNACKADHDKAWKALLDSAFKEQLEINAGALAVSLAKEGKHPRTYIKYLATVSRWYRFYYAEFRAKNINTQPRIPSAYAFFIRAQQCEWEVEQYKAKTHAASLGMAKTEYDQFPSLFNWAGRQWQELPQWRRDVYAACFRVVDERLKREAAAKAAARASCA